MPFLIIPTLFFRQLCSQLSFRQANDIAVVLLFSTNRLLPDTPEKLIEAIRPYWIKRCMVNNLVLLPSDSAVAAANKFARCGAENQQILLHWGLDRQHQNATAVR